MDIYTGVVESRDDPLKLGRCQVRIVGLHTEDKTILPTADLPWAYPLQPITSAGINGIGWTPTGPVPGTWVVLIFRDAEMQLPIMLGTIGGIPQSKAAEKFEASSDNIVTDGGVLVNSLGKALLNKDGSDLTLDQGLNVAKDVIGNLLGVDLNSFFKDGKLSLPVEGANDPNKPTVIPNIEKGADAPLTAQPEPGKADPAVLSTDIKVDPPAKYAPSDLAKAKQCISALIAACDKVGLTSKYAKCSILGICGGESKWLPVEEGYSYPADSLLKVFPSVFQGDTAKAQQYARWKGERKEFFREIYNPKYKNGKACGNKQADDGALFYGRGFNQITGRSLYEQLANAIKPLGGGDIAKDPDLLINDINTSALATAMFYKINVKADQNDPAYFQAALKRTGNPVGDSYEKKKILYEYFLGQGVIADSTNKPAADADKTYSKDEVAGLPKQKQMALLEDRSENSSVGFCDPSGKYPLRNLLDEPDTNRLGRGVIKETAIEFKDQIRTKGIEAANGETSWEQPLAPFGGKYPYNKVYETESGHLSIFDDTPGHENISFYHRKGSFIDVDANGTQVNKIVGDGYTIIDRNGFIAIEGRCNIMVGNSANILVKGSADIEVNGPTTANLHGDVSLGCARDVEWTVGGDLKLKVDGNFSATVGKGIDLYSSTYINAESKTSTQMKSGEKFNIQGSSEVNVKSSGKLYLGGSGDVNIKSVKNVLLDGTTFKYQTGASKLAGEVTSNITPLTLTAPDFRAATPNTFDVLQTPVRPSPPVELKTELQAANSAQFEDFKKNPGKYYNADAEAAGVNPQRSPQPDVGDAGQSMISGAAAGDIAAFLTKQLALAKEGHWSETGMGGKSSNPNILAIWKDIGLGNIGTSDQVSWCAAFVNWTLKQCNYRYFQSARAFDFRDKPNKWNLTKVDDPQPGDICVWSYSHVNFVYTVKDGKCTFVGGNQGGGKVTDNNPSGGSVTISYPSGVSTNHKNIVGFYRPSKT